ncbi:unnamed protein product [Jaminaea pallidilutea]
MDEQISQFSAITGASADRARFFIESSGGDVQAAIATYYESEGQEAGDEEDQQGGESTVVPPTATAGQSAPSAPSAAAPSGGPRTLSGAPAEPLPAGWGSGSGSDSRATASSSSRNQPTTSSTGFSAGGGIRTFRDLAGDAPSGRGGGGGGGRGDDDDEDDDDDDDPQNLFAGGERSGLSVQNPDSGRRRRGDQPDVVSEILRRAAAAGAAGGGGDGQHGFGDDEGQVPASSAPAPASFGGAGRTIGDESSGPEAPVPATGGQPTPSVPSGNDEGGEEDDPVVTRQLTFWSDGFSIGDGALQRYDDPQSAALLAAIENNNAPPEAFGIRFGQRVVIQVAKRLGEKYSPPPPAPMKAFSGGGNRLGSPAPATTTTGGNESASTSGPSGTATTASNAAAPQEVSVDESKPTTRIQIRLADGTRLVGRFNQEQHTVAHIRGFINASSPGMSARSYALQTSFPPKAIEDESQTLKDAGLVNAVVQQKWA